MAATSYIHVANITTPISTPIDAPQQTALTLGWCMLNSVYLRIPAGHQGLTGWALSVNGVPVIPWQQPGVYLVGDNEVFSELMGLQIDTGLEIVTYNLDTAYPHTHYARFSYTPIAAANLPKSLVTPLELA